MWTEQVCGNVYQPGGVWWYGERGQVVVGTVSSITLHVKVEAVLSHPSDWLIPSDSLCSPPANQVGGGCAT